MSWRPSPCEDLCPYRVGMIGNDETLTYGFQEARGGADSGDHWRVQLGMAYSLFD